MIPVKRRRIDALWCWQLEAGRQLQHRHCAQHERIEVRQPFARHDVERMGRRHRRITNAGHQLVPDIGHGDDSGAQGNGLALRPRGNPLPS